MDLFRIIKHDAKALLRLCWGRVIMANAVFIFFYLAVTLAESLLVFVLSGAKSFAVVPFGPDSSSLGLIAFSFAFSIVYVLVIPAVALGQTKLCFAFANGEDESLALVFDRFSSFKKFFGAVVFSIAYALRLLLTFVFCALPGGAFVFFIASYMPKGGAVLEILKLAGFLVGFLLLVLCFALGIIFSQRWVLAPYYLASGEKIHKSFVLSAKATKGNRVKLVAFKFLFVVWAPSCILMLPILWVLPYYQVSNAIYAKYLMEKYNRSLAQVPETVEKPLAFDLAQK